VLETIAVPILLKAVEFIFGEGSKILAERRERRRMPPEPPPSIEPAPDAIRTREAALKQPIDVAGWTESEANIKHLQSMLEIYTKNYHLAKEEYAKWGSALVPPIIVHSLAEAEDGVAVTMEQLQVALSKAYGKQVVVPEVVRA
jgi:hypothetical protein